MSDGVSVTPRPNEPAEQMIKRFMRRWKSSKIQQELFERMGYDKPSVKRRKKRLRNAFKRSKDESREG